MSSFIIRPPCSPEELADHLQGYVEVNQAFSPDPFPEDTADRLLRKLITLPGYRPEQVRSAYRNGEHLGGYRIYDRLLRMGSARLATGCIGGVYTRAHARHHGVATALMHDALMYAQAHQYPLLLLDGIPKFYHRYGYCDVYDLSTLELDRQAVLALSESPYTVRRSRLSDASGLLSLYERQVSLSTGSFERSLEQQIHWMHHLEKDVLWVAIDRDEQVRGYLYFAAAQARGAFFLAGTQVWELVVEDWPASVALLQDQARMGESRVSPTAAETLLYSVPPMSSLADLLLEQLEVVDLATWDMPVLGWAVRKHTFCHRRAGWMARLVNPPALTRAMLPEWQARWHRSLARRSGDVSLKVGDEAFMFRFAGTDLHLLETSDTGENTFSLTPQAFTQVVFGYYPITSVMQANVPLVSDDLTTVLTILFPTGQTWIAPSDWF